MGVYCVHISGNLFIIVTYNIYILVSNYYIFRHIILILMSSTWCGILWHLGKSEHFEQLILNFSFFKCIFIWFDSWQMKCFWSFQKPVYIIVNDLCRYLIHVKTFFSVNLFLYFSSIVKQVLTTCLNHSRVRFLEPTSTGVIMRNHGRDPCGVRIHVRISVKA